MMRLLRAVGWLLAIPGLILGLGLAAELAGFADAAGCQPERFLAVRCPEGLIGQVANDLHDLGMIVLLAPQFAVLPMIYSAIFVAARLGALLLRSADPAPRRSIG